MTTEQLQRMGFIGASEIGAVCGLDPFCTPLKLYGLKTGLIAPDDLSDNEAVEWGQRLERVVSQKFAEKHNVKLIAYKKRFFHPEYDFLSCELDNIIAGTDELVEVKTASAWQMKKWENQDEIPAHYICQVMMQLGLSRRKVGHIAVLLGGQKYLERKVEFDQEFYDGLVEKAVAFWRMVEEKTPPMAGVNDNEALLSLYPSNKSDEIIQGIEEFNTAIARRQEICMHIDNMEAEKEEIENRLKQVIGENVGIRTTDYLLTWKSQSRKSVDTALLKADGLYDKYAKESSTRVLRVAKNKEQ